MTRRLFNGGAHTRLTIVLLWGVLQCAPRAHAADATPLDLVSKSHRGPCATADLKGVFGFYLRGYTMADSGLPAPLLGPQVAVGTTAFDGKGNVSISSSSFNGVVQAGPILEKASYSLNNDCTISSRTTTGTTAVGVLVDQGREFFTLQTTPGTVISGVGQRQASSAGDLRDALFGTRPLRCTRQPLAGTYGFLAEGYAGPPTIPAEFAGFLAGVGTLRVGTNGEFELVGTRSVNGALDPQPLELQGKVSINSDCSFSMRFDVGFTFNGLIVDGGQEALFVETDLGTTLLVRAKRL